jgi:uncharacterized protein (DUF697 family)/tellurite resistance protein
MQATEQRSLLSIALLAALADGHKADRERDAIQRFAQTLSAEGGAALADVYPDVLLGRTDVNKAAEGLSQPAHRQLAYEIAVCVCDADGQHSPAEKAFLDGLKTALGLSSDEAAQLQAPADEIAALPIGVQTAAAPVVQSAALMPAAGPATGPIVAATPKVPEAELQASILNHAILNGALELLPQSWASMAIIPLQMKLVYRIGQAYGYELDRGHLKEFVATAGVGLTSQYLEQFGRKLLGGLLGSVGGGLGRMMGGAATGMAFSFASTYALGQLAQRYYAGGRQMSTALLQETFQSLLEPAKQLQAQYLPQIQQRASTLDAGKIMAMVKSA